MCNTLRINRPENPWKQTHGLADYHNNIKAENSHIAQQFEYLTVRPHLPEATWPQPQGLNRNWRAMLWLLTRLNGCFLHGASGNNDLYISYYNFLLQNKPLPELSETTGHLKNATNISINAWCNLQRQPLIPAKHKDVCLRQKIASIPHENSFL